MAAWPDVQAPAWLDNAGTCHRSLRRAWRLRLLCAEGGIRANSADGRRSSGSGRGQCPVAGSTVQQQNFLAREGAPIAPDRLEISICESMLGIELELIDFEIRQMLHQLQQSRQIWDAATGNIQHDSAPLKIRVVPD